MTVLEMLKELKKEILDGESHIFEPRDAAYNAGIFYAEDVVEAYIKKVEAKELGIVSV